MKEGKFLSLYFEDAIGVLTINRPPHNILGMEFYAELAEFQQMIGEEAIRTLIIRAEGANFSAGIDLNNLAQVDSMYILENLPWLQKIYGHWQDLHIPVIAAIQGLCCGSAVELILGCDIRIAADNARFSLPEVGFGLSPDMGGTARLARLVGIGQAKRMIMCCDEVDAAEAHRIGLVEYIKPLDEIDEFAKKLAMKLRDMPVASVAFAKKGINLAVESGITAGLLFEQAQSVYCCGTSDQKAAIAAFLEKRKKK